MCESKRVTLPLYASLRAEQRQRPTASVYGIFISSRAGKVVLIKSVKFIAPDVTSLTHRSYCITINSARKVRDGGWLAG